MKMSLKKISRALISVSDKTDLKKILEVLDNFKVEIVSTGGTYKFIKHQGYKCKEISDYTGFPEIMNGRVKTLHPKIYGGLLSDLNIQNHLDSMKKHSIEEINLVIVNLYPFESKLSDLNSSEKILIENIDIGGPSMLRSAAKNFEHVTVLPSIKYYDEFIKLMSYKK